MPAFTMAGGSIAVLVLRGHIWHEIRKGQALAAL
jgi:hypothetical protein